MDKVSIIVPAYNSEKYLTECIESIINQTYKNIEIIIINDGSIDKTEQICQKYKQKDDRIIFISRENRGASYTRNEAISISSGKYLCFVDSDDYLATDFIETLINKINEYDLVTCGYYIKYIDNERKMVGAKDNIQLKRKEALDALFFDNMYRGFLWNKIFKKEIITQNKIYFENDIKMCEDLIFVYKYISVCNKVLYIPEAKYFYRKRKTSISNSSIIYKEALKAYDKLLKLDEKNEQLTKNYINLNINMFLSTNNKEDKIIAKNNIKKYKNILNDKLSFKDNLKLTIKLKCRYLFKIKKYIKNIILKNKIFE